MKEKKKQKISKTAKTRIRYNQVSHQTQDTKWESDKNTSEHHTQEASPPQDCNEQKRKHDKHET